MVFEAIAVVIYVLTFCAAFALGAKWEALRNVPSNAAIEGPGEDGVACTLEAKLCPDGTPVGRVGPNCEFAPCP